MTTSDALWDVFKATGYIGAYLLYKDCQVSEDESVLLGCKCLQYIDAVQAE